MAATYCRRNSSIVYNFSDTTGRCLCARHPDPEGLEENGLTSAYFSRSVD